MLAKDLAELIGHTTKRRIKNRVEMKDDRVVDPLPSENLSSSNGTKDNTMARRLSICRNRKKMRKYACLNKSQKSKMVQCSSSSLTFLDNVTEYSTSKNNSGSKSSDRDHRRRHLTNPSGNGLEVNHTMNTRFQRTVYYRRYRLKSTF